MNSPNLGKQTMLGMYRRMLLIRAFEDKVQELFLAKKISGTTHLCSGQEAVSVGVCQALSASDYLTCTYRGHGVLISRGSEVNALMAEMLGKMTGINKGKGGSMHLADFERGVIGSFAIVGAGLPIANGAALASQFQGNRKVSIAFFGDGATNIGAFHESLNLAGIWKLPVIFVCENNLYGEYTPIGKTTPVANISDRASSYGIKGAIVNGNDVLEVYNAASEARARALDSNGPTLLECKTYRFKGHSRTDQGLYRPKEEVEAWMQRDPIELFKRFLLESGNMDSSVDQEIRKEVQEQINQAVDYATNSPWPEESDLYQDLFTGGGT